MLAPTYPMPEDKFPVSDNSRHKQQKKQGSIPREIQDLRSIQQEFFLIFQILPVDCKQKKARGMIHTLLIFPGLLCSGK